jgi:phage tail protein X
MLQYLTKAGDTLDWVCWRQYGTRTGAVEAVLEANQGLADAGPVLPAGLTINLPDLPEPQQPATVRIWG